MKQFIIILFLVISFVSKAQPPSKFFSTYGGNGYDVGYGVKQTLDNGYIITGSTSSFGQGNTDLYLLKLDSMGQKKLETSFGGSSNEIGKGVVQLSDSGYVMVGYTSSFGIGGYDVFLVKADKTGNLVWKKTIGGSDWDFAYSIQQTTDGGFIIAGTTYSFGYGNADGYVVKTDVNGNIVWSKTYGGKKDDEFKCVVQTSDGNYALTGYTKSYSDSLGDSWVFKIDTNGDSLWSKYYGGNKEDFGNGIVENNLGELYIAGATTSTVTGLLAAYGYKTDMVGTISFTTTGGFTGKREVYNAVTISKRTAQERVCFIQEEIFPGFQLQVKIIEYDFWLNYKDATDYGSNVEDEVYQITSTRDKGYAFVGYTKGYNSKLTDVYVGKIDSALVGGNFSIVSVNEVTKNDLKIELYPNPSSKEIIMKSPIRFTDDDIKLFDAMGNELFIKDKIISLENNNKIMNIEEFSSGLYYLKIFNKTNRISIIH